MLSIHVANVVCVPSRFLGIPFTQLVDMSPPLLWVLLLVAPTFQLSLKNWSHLPWKCLGLVPPSHRRVHSGCLMRVGGEKAPPPYLKMEQLSPRAPMDRAEARHPRKPHASPASPPSLACYPALLGVSPEGIHSLNKSPA